MNTNNVKPQTYLLYKINLYLNLKSNCLKEIKELFHTRFESKQ